MEIYVSNACQEAKVAGETDPILSSSAESPMGAFNSVASQHNSLPDEGPAVKTLGALISIRLPRRTPAWCWRLARRCYGSMPLACPGMILASMARHCHC